MSEGRQKEKKSSAPVKPDLWVGLVLHTLDQHALDDLHVVLLLVAKDTREVPAAQARVRVNKDMLSGVTSSL